MCHNTYIVACISRIRYFYEFLDTYVILLMIKTLQCLKQNKVFVKCKNPITWKVRQYWMHCVSFVHSNINIKENQSDWSYSIFSSTIEFSFTEWNKIKIRSDLASLCWNEMHIQTISFQFEINSHLNSSLKVKGPGKSKCFLIPDDMQCCIHFFIRSNSISII